MNEWNKSIGREKHGKKEGSFMLWGTLLFTKHNEGLLWMYNKKGVNSGNVSFTKVCIYF